MAPSKKINPTTTRVNYREDAELTEKVISASSKGDLEEISVVLHILEKRQSEIEKGGANIIVPKSVQVKLWNQQAVLRFQFLKVAQDVITDKDKEVSEDFIQRSFVNFDILLDLPNKLGDIGDNKISELYARLSYLACQIGFRLQKRKMYLESLSWCDRAILAHDVWKSTGSQVSDVKMNTRWLALLKAECLRVLERAEEGLKWLSQELATDPTYWERPTVCYDLFEQIPWTEISTHWVTLYKEMCTINPQYNKCSLDFLEEGDPISISQETISRVLRLELNSHFSARHGIPSAMVAIGEALVERSFCHFDNVLGYVAMASGYYFGTPDDVDYALKLVHDAVELIESDDFFRRERNADSTAFLSGLVSIWRGLCLLKTHQYFAEAEMSHLKEQFVAENQDKFKDRDTGEEIRGVSGLSMLNLDHERDWVCSLVHGIEIFFRFSESELVLKKFSNEFCPSVILMSCRLAASLLIAVGDLLTGTKAWYVVNKLAKIYDKKGIMILSASEIVKVIPDLDCEIVTLADKVNAECDSQDLIKHNRAAHYRLSLAKSIACYNLGQYEQGVAHLLHVFQYFETKDNFDATHHLMGEATYVLCWYRTIQFSHKIDLSAFPQSLVKMSPAGIATKAFKTLGGMSRDPDFTNSGWTDLIHNFFLLSCLFEVGTYTMKVLRESGKTRELRCFISDLVNFTQHAGFVSRSLGLIVPMITLDITSRNFMHAQMKIDAVNQVLNNSICPEEIEDGDTANYQKIMDNMKLPITLQRMECMNDLKWVMKSLDIPSLYYRNRSEKVIAAMKTDLRPEFNNTQFQFPEWMRHNLSCSCYVCSHPLILPIAFEFIHSQAKYLNCLPKAKSAMAVLETTKLYHERAIFRLIYNLSLMCVPLVVIASKKWTLKAVENIYTPFCVGPGLDSLMTQMMICPVTDIKMILNAMKKAKLIIETIDPKDYIGKSFPLEMGYSALYKYFVSSGDIKVKGSEIRDIIEKKLNSQAEDNKINCHSPAKFEGPLLDMAPPPPKKGILKVTAKRAPRIKEELIDDCPVVHVPFLKFEPEDEDSEPKSSSSCSSASSLSVPSDKIVKENAQKVKCEPAQTKTLRSQKTAPSGVTERRPRRGATANK